MLSSLTVVKYSETSVRCWLVHTLLVKTLNQIIYMHSATQVLCGSLEILFNVLSAKAFTVSLIIHIF